MDRGRYDSPMMDGPFQHNALPIGGMACAAQNWVNVLNPPQLPVADEEDMDMFLSHGRLKEEDWKLYDHHHDHNNDNGSGNGNGSSSGSGRRNNVEKLNEVNIENTSKSREFKDRDINMGSTASEADADADAPDATIKDNTEDDSRKMAESTSSSSSSSTLFSPSKNYFQQFNEVMERDSNTILGMKVIRIQMADWKPYHAAKFLRANFPCSRFLINIRSNVTELVESYHKNFNWDISQVDMEKKTEYLRLLHHWLNDEGLGKRQLEVEGEGEGESEGEGDAEEIDAKKERFKIEKSSIHTGDKSGKQSTRSGGEEHQLQLQSKLIDFSHWKDDIQLLNDVIDWLGFEGCSFNAIRHENMDGFKRDKTTKLHLGDKCRYPYV